uniref:Large ribosomal subunit protein bL9c n=1 Tax=Galaxaura rugosa TaxID=268570 RepID=A0A1G4NTK7_9FLOR|nr:Ribosomal protein L9 [Galaxaura rugosa]SCW21839.1 Ribosomal protein L9 [Galaxaura rugosa]
MANKKINVILNKKLKNFGEPGNIIEVTKGYARNYLFPNQIAEPITARKLRYLEYLKLMRIQNDNIKKNEAKEIKESLTSIDKLIIKRKVSTNNNIFGSITQKDIIEKIKELTNIQLDKDQIKLTEIKKIGIYIVYLKLLEDLNLEMTLQVIPETI